jgi:hypothetical protein
MAGGSRPLKRVTLMAGAACVQNGFFGVHNAVLISTKCFRVPSHSVSATGGEIEVLGPNLYINDVYGAFLRRELKLQCPPGFQRHNTCVLHSPGFQAFDRTQEILDITISTE